MKNILRYVVVMGLVIASDHANAFSGCVPGRRCSEKKKTLDLTKNPIIRRRPVPPRVREAPARPKTLKEWNEGKGPLFRDMSDLVDFTEQSEKTHYYKNEACAFFSNLKKEGDYTWTKANIETLKTALMESNIKDLTSLNQPCVASPTNGLSIVPLEILLKRKDMHSAFRLFLLEKNWLVPLLKLPSASQELSYLLFDFMWGDRISTDFWLMPIHNRKYESPELYSIVLEMRSRTGETVLHKIMSSSHYNTETFISRLLLFKEDLKLLIRHTAQIPLCSIIQAQATESGNTALHELMYSSKDLMIEKLKYLKELLSTCKIEGERLETFVETPNKQGQKAIHALAVVDPPSGFLDKLLVMAGTKARTQILENFGRFQRQTLLHWFAASRPGLVEELAKFVTSTFPNSDDVLARMLNAKEELSGATPLHIAALYGVKQSRRGAEGIQVFELLNRLETDNARKKVLMQTDNTGRTCLMSAAQGRNIDAMRAILDNASSFLDELVTMQNAQGGRTFLHDLYFYRFEGGDTEALLKEKLGDDTYRKLLDIQDDAGRKCEAYERDGYRYREADYQIVVAAHDEISPTEYRDPVAGGTCISRTPICGESMAEYVKCLKQKRGEESKDDDTFVHDIIRAAPIFRAAWRRWKKWVDVKEKPMNRHCVVFVGEYGAGEEAEEEEEEVKKSPSLAVRVMEKFYRDIGTALRTLEEELIDDDEEEDERVIPERLRVVLEAHGNEEEDGVFFLKGEAGGRYNAENIARIIKQNYFLEEETLQLSIVVDSCRSGEGPFCERLANEMILADDGRKSTTVTCNLGTVISDGKDGGFRSIRQARPFRDDHASKIKFEWDDDMKKVIRGYIPVRFEKD